MTDSYWNCWLSSSSFRRYCSFSSLAFLCYSRRIYSFLASILVLNSRVNFAISIAFYSFKSLSRSCFCCSIVTLNCSRSMVSFSSLIFKLETYCSLNSRALRVDAKSRSRKTIFCCCRAFSFSFSLDRPLNLSSASLDRCSASSIRF